MVTGRKSTRIASPACRIVEVAVSRCPLIAIASAPAAHSAFEASCRSVSLTRASILRAPVTGSTGVGPSPRVIFAPGAADRREPGRRFQVPQLRHRRPAQLPFAQGGHLGAQRLRLVLQLDRVWRRFCTCSTSVVRARSRAGSSATVCWYATTSRNPSATRVSAVTPLMICFRTPVGSPSRARRAAASA